MKAETGAKTADMGELDQLHGASAAELAKLGRQREAISALQKRLLQEDRHNAQAAYAKRRQKWQKEYEEERRQAEGVLMDLRQKVQASTHVHSLYWTCVPLGSLYHWAVYSACPVL